MCVLQSASTLSIGKSKSSTSLELIMKLKWKRSIMYMRPRTRTSRQTNNEMMSCNYKYLNSLIKTVMWYEWDIWIEELYPYMNM